MMTRDGYDLRTIHDGRGGVMGFVWQKQGRTTWGAVLAGHCECCAPEKHLGSFPSLAQAAAVVAGDQADRPDRNQSGASQGIA
jgi:hypothetical protein